MMSTTSALGESVVVDTDVSKRIGISRQSQTVSSVASLAYVSLVVMNLFLPRLEQSGASMRFADHCRQLSFSRERLDASL